MWTNSMAICGLRYSISPWIFVYRVVCFHNSCSVVMFQCSDWYSWYNKMILWNAFIYIQRKIYIVGSKDERAGVLFWLDSTKVQFMWLKLLTLEQQSLYHTIPHHTHIYWQPIVRGLTDFNQYGITRRQFFYVVFFS